MLPDVPTVEKEYMVIKAISKLLDQTSENDGQRRYCMAPPAPHQLVI